jgi:hypothetical protein
VQYAEPVTSFPRQMRHELASYVAKKDLEQEHFNRRHWPQLALAPLMACLPTGPHNRVVLQFLTPTLLELVNNPCDVPIHCRASV